MNSITPHPSPEALSALHDGQLNPPELQAHVQAHVLACDECSLEMHRLAAMSGLLANNTPSLSQIGRARLHQQIDNMLENAGDSSLVRFGIRISSVAASVLLVGSIWLLMSSGQSSVISQSAPPWVGVAVTSDADTVVRNASTPAAAIYLADASSSEAN